MLDVVAAAEKQRDEDGPGALRTPLAVQRGEGVGQQRLVQLDVAEAYVEAGAQLTDQIEERCGGAQGARVAAAVGDGDEGGPFGRWHTPAGSVPCDVAELGAQLVGDAREQLRGGVQGGRVERPGAERHGAEERCVEGQGLARVYCRLRHEPILPGRDCGVVAWG